MPARRFQPRDHELSWRINRRPKEPNPDEASLRSLAVHRLRNTLKAVHRVGLLRGAHAVFCEPCVRWQKVAEPLTQWTCQQCRRAYQVEVIIYNEVPSEQAPHVDAAGADQGGDVRAPSPADDQR